MKIACLIPARLHSTRFPKKILSLLGGKPLIQWVWEAATRVPLFSEVVFAIDDEETARAIDAFGGRYLMTSKECLNGTQRLIEVYSSLQADIWTLWQADEPFVNGAIIQELVQSCGQDGCSVWTLCKKIASTHDLFSPHVVKVVRNQESEALYFSRSPIPYVREENSNQFFYKHVGLYAFNEEALRIIAKTPPCALEMAEQLEQLRFLYAKLKIKVHETEQELFGIDIPAHLELAQKFIDSHQNALI
jgi:3-deoxy-manno-octulosonate cytidylyltransferase (CMP-KDO synthetase)